MPIIQLLIPILKIALPSFFAVIGESFLRKNTQLQRRKADIEIGREALKTIDQIIASIVLSIEQYKKHNIIDTASISNMASAMARNSISEALRKEANNVILDIDAYIIRQIEASVFEMNQQIKK